MKDGLYWVQQLKEQKVSHTELLKDIEKKVQKLNPKINGFVTFDSQKAEATYQKINSRTHYLLVCHFH